MGRPARGRKDLVELDRRAEHDQIVGSVREPLDVPPEADEQQRVAGLELLLEQAVAMHRPAAPQADHGQAVVAPHARLEHGQADQPGLGRHQSLDHAELLRAVGQVAAGPDQRQRLERIFLPQRLDLEIGRADVDQQDVAGPQLGARLGPDDLGPEAVAALDRQEVHAARTQGELPERLSHQGRARRHARAVLPSGQPILFDPVAQGRPARARAVRVGRRREPAPREQHVDDAENQHRHAEGRHAEEVEARRALAHELGIDHEVRCRRDQRQHAADQRREAQRHHQPARRRAGVLREAQHHRDEDRDDRGRAHHRAEPGHSQHQQHQQAGLAAARPRVQPVAEAPGHAGANQALADHEQGRDQDHVRIAEAREGLLHGDDAAQRQRRDHDQRHHVHAWPVDHEHHDRCREQQQDDGEIEAHQDRSGRKRSATGAPLPTALSRGPRAGPAGTRPQAAGSTPRTAPRCTAASARSPCRRRSPSGISARRSRSSRSRRSRA